MPSVIDTFVGVFSSAGFTRWPHQPIFPCQDRTTLFTSATISTLRPLLSADECTSVFLAQPCLRVQNLQKVLDEDFDPEYLSSFEMLGTQSSIKKFRIDCVTTFFNSFPKLATNLLVRSSTTLKDNLFRVIEASYQTEFDTRPVKYYTWEYGDNVLAGEGLTFAIQQPNGVFSDVGNLVVILRNAIPIAVEFGIGVETFTARLNGLESPFRASLDYNKLGLGLRPWEKRLGDSLILARKLYVCGVLPGKGRESSVMRKALRGSCFIAIRQFANEATGFLKDIAAKLGAEQSWNSLIAENCLDVVKTLEKFHHEVEHMKGHATGDRLARKVAEYRIRYNIPEGF